MRTLTLGMTLLAATALLTSGCFKSSTSQASSESSSAFSSSCSPSGDGDSAYERDVRDYAVAHAGANADVERFETDLADLARAYGLSDWQGDRATHIASGRGFADAGLDASTADSLATRLARADRTRTDWLLGGFRIAAK